MLDKNGLKIILVVLQLSAVAIEATKNKKSDVLTTAETTQKEDGVTARKGKYFSLFNVVHFNNGGCISQLANGANGNRAGSCYTSEECANKGGTSSGNCAAGFGVCCVFIFSGTGAININQVNCSYLTNVGYPTATTAPAAVTYTINKCTNDVCSLRLDFLNFNTLAQTDSNEPLGGACQDQMTLSVTGQGAGTVGALPVICGSNTGQHVYLQLGQLATDTATVAFTFAAPAVAVGGAAVAATTARTWDVKVTQVLCGTPTPPPGCLQYFTATTGQFETFNFDSGKTSHLANQRYTTCIRPAEGFCCIEYIPCQGVPGAFSLNEMGAVIGNNALTDSSCVNDYIIISGAQSQCSKGATGVAQSSRICGTHFGAFNQMAIPPLVAAGMYPVTQTPICDCSQPFSVSVVTDALPDIVPAPILSRGVCLTYMQLPC